MAVDVAANFKADPANAGWYSDTRTGERLYQGALDALVRDGEDRPLIRGVKLADGFTDGKTARIILGDFNAGGNVVYIGAGAADTWSVEWPGTLLAHAEAALDTANLTISKLQAQLAAAGSAKPDPTVLRNAAIGAAFLDLQSLAAGGK